MTWIETSLTRLETRLRELIEGYSSDGIDRKLHIKLVDELTKAMRSASQEFINGGQAKGAQVTVPDQYTLVLPDEHAKQLLAHPAELDMLTRMLEKAAVRSGVRFATAPVLRVVADPQLSEMKILVEYSHNAAGGSRTTKIAGMSGRPGNGVAGLMPNAFLIVNGLTTYPITNAVVNIGRDPSNQVQLDDLRVSRSHAQLRLIHGRFAIFDLDSTGGTFVNGVPVTSQILNPGDVILLAGVPLVYGQEAPSQDGFTQELPVDPPAPLAR